MNCLVLLLSSVVMIFIWIQGLVTRNVFLVLSVITTVNVQHCTNGDSVKIMDRICDEPILSSILMTMKRKTGTGFKKKRYMQSDL